MRKFTLLLCLLLPLFAGAQWSLLTSDYDDGMVLYDVYAHDSRIVAGGYDGNFKGHIFNSNDYGKTWDTTMTGGILQKTIAFKDADTGFMAGYGSISFWYRTVDGGANWEPYIADNDFKGVADMMFLNDKVGFAGGYGDKQFFTGNCYKTVDGGQLWTPSDTTDDVLDTIGIERIFFLDEQTGYGVNNFFGGKFIIKTTNGGTNWSLVYTHNTFVGDVHFWNVNNGILVDSKGKVYKTTDGGTTWTEKNSPVLNGLNSLVFLNDKVGYAVGSFGTVIETADGGETWTKQPAVTNANLLRIRSYNGNLYASGSKGTVIMKGWPANVKETATGYKLNIYPNPASSVLYISSVNNVYKNIEATLTDITGKTVAKAKRDSGIIQMDIAALPAGTYHVTVNADGNIHSETIVVNH